MNSTFVKTALCTVLLAGPLQAAETTDCLILPGKIVDLSGTIPGQLSSVDVSLGDRVESGQIIASLRTEVQETIVAQARFRSKNDAAVAAARARLDYEQREMERAEQLRDRGVMSAANAEERETAFKIRARELEEAEMERQGWKLELQRAEAELEIRRIRAPISGVVAERYLDPGEYLRDDGKVVTLVSLDPLRVEVFFPQQLRTRIAEGASAEVWPEGTSASFPAVVETVDAVIDAASGTFRVRLILDNPNERIIAGVRCKVSIAEAG